jgi:hypothetical protein
VAAGIHRSRTQDNISTSRRTFRPDSEIVWLIEVKVDQPIVQDLVVLELKAAEVEESSYMKAGRQ